MAVAPSAASGGGVQMSEGIGAIAVRGVFWTGAGQVVRQVVQIVGSIVLARLLAPEDFGLLGMAMFVIGIGQLFADFGIGSAIVQARADDRVVLSSCFWLNVIVAGGLALLVAAASPLVARFYARPDLTVLVAVLAANLLLAGLQAVPLALLYRDMRFADLARVQVLGSLFGALAAILLAWRGFGVWALVVQPLAGSAVALLMALRATRWSPQWTLRWSEVAPLARFSAALLGTNLVGYANRNSDGLLVGRFLGASALGIYSMAIQIMLYPLQQVSSVIVRVLFPTLVQIRDDVPRLRGAYLRAVGGIAVITFPMMAGLFAVADDFVAVVFGPGWTALAPLIKIVAWVGMAQSVGTTIGTIYLATGHAGLALRVTLTSAPILIAGMAAGLPWGVRGVAIGYALASFALFYYVALRGFRLISLSVMQFHRTIYRPLLASLAMMAIVLRASQAMTELQAAARLTGAIAIGVVAYAILSMLINRGQMVEIRILIGSLRLRVNS
jgi:PST family polysaccharide transporter